MSYKDLKSFQQASVIYDFTVEFCDQYVDKKSRTIDQMTQAARSGKQNIAEGCAQSKNKPKSEHYLLSIASASFKELLEDYEDFLRQRGLRKWEKDDPRAVEVRRIPYRSDTSDRTDRSYKTYTTYKTYLDAPERAANAMICLINQTTYLLDQQIKAVERQMEGKGISSESHGQKLRRIMQEEKKEHEEFDAYLQKIVDGAKNRSDKTDKLHRSDSVLGLSAQYGASTSDITDDMSNQAYKSGRLDATAGFITKKALLVCGLVMLLLLGGFAVMYRSDKSDNSDTSTSVFSSSVSPIIPLGISVAEAASLPQGIALIESNINITGPRGERINEKVNLNLKPQDNGEYGLVMNPKDEQAFTPGKYTVSADIETSKGIRHITQDFLWGVLAINPNKSIYRPGETAKFALAVLDEKGMMVCDAQVKLQITNPKSQTKTLTTNNNSIRVNDECRQKKVTQRPDYETEYQVSDPGTYQMTLTAISKNGTYTIEDYVEVRDSVPFDIERISATRIYPVHEYPVTIKVKPDVSFRGMVEETVPLFFEITNDKPQIPNKFQTTNSNDQKRILWNVDWKAGETYELSYIYKSPELSPQFYLLGPLVLRQAQDDKEVFREVRPDLEPVFVEARQWQIAVDVTCGFGTDIGGGVCRGYLTSGTSWSVPSDWNDSDNRIEVIGGGGGGESGSEADGGGAGGGGAYSSAENIDMPEGSSVTYAVGAAGTPAQTSAAATSGGDTYICSSTSNCASIVGSAVVVGAKGGSKFTGAHLGGPGGAAASGVAVGTNPLTFSGGDGGNGGPSNNDGGGGGGGAAGPDLDGTGAAGRNGGVGDDNGSAGGGGAGGDSSSAGNNAVLASGGTGGNGPNGNGGGTLNNDGSAGGGGGGSNDNDSIPLDHGGDGGNGTEWDSTHGAGGGGGGGADDGNAGNGGAYGGGGGGGGEDTGTTGGTGGQGIIVITYTPAAGNSTPSISSVIDTPDPTNPGRSVTFSTSWTDSDSTTVKVKVCKSSTLSSQNCSDGSWASSTVFTSQTPENLVYDIVGGDAGTTRSYFVHSCDDGGTCTSTSTAGTFTVNLFSDVPNTKIRGAQGSGAGKVNWR